jgi:aminotransferase
VLIHEPPRRRPRALPQARHWLATSVQMAAAVVVEAEAGVAAPAAPTPLEAALTARARPAASASPFEQEMAAARAQLGEGLVNLASGDPDLPTPAHITAAAIAAIEGGQHHYTPKNGLPALRDAISFHLQRTIGMSYSSAEICATAGVQEAMFSCFLALTGAGEEVLVPAPTYLSYQKQTALTGAICVDVPCTAEHDFVVQPADIEAAITPRTKILVHVSPNNPTGAVTPPVIVQAIANLAIKYNLIVLSDEIYSDMMYDGRQHLSIATLPGMRDRTVVLNGCSKAFAMTGWRVGYLAAPAPFIEAITAIAGQLSLSVATPSQHAAIAALTGPMDAVNDMMDVYSERRDYMFKEFNRLGFRV